MAKHKTERSTTNSIGLKINEVMREKNIVGDYALVATHFGVKVPSVYGWIDTGRISKDKLPKLELWSGRPLSWWLDADTNTVSTSTDLRGAEQGVRQGQTPSPSPELSIDTIAQALTRMTDAQRETMAGKLAALARAPDSPTLKKSISESLGSVPLPLNDST